MCEISFVMFRGSPRQRWVEDKINDLCKVSTRETCVITSIRVESLFNALIYCIHPPAQMFSVSQDVGQPWYLGVYQLSIWLKNIFYVHTSYLATVVVVGGSLENVHLTDNVWEYILFGVLLFFFTTIIRKGCLVISSTALAAIFVRKTRDFRL